MHYLLVAMETTTLTHCTNRIGKCMMHIVEEHLIPAMLSSEKACHDLMQNLERTLMVLVSEEIIPLVRVREVRHEKPSRTITASTANRHCEQEL